MFRRPVRGHAARRCGVYVPVTLSSIKSGSTDGQGRTVDFKNTIVIMTSNVGSQRILQFKGSHIGEVYDRMKDAVLEELRKAFRPEFLNRIDDIVVFHTLTEARLTKIVEIQLGNLRKRLAERKVSLMLTDAAKEHIVPHRVRPATVRGPSSGRSRRKWRRRSAPSDLEGRHPRRREVSRWTSTRRRTWSLIRGQAECDGVTKVNEMPTG